MGTRGHDPSLSPKERAAFAAIEAAAAAEDPTLAAVLRRARWRRLPILAALRSLWTAAALLVLGTALTVVGLVVSASAEADGLAVAIAGLVLACAGMTCLGHGGRRRGWWGSANS